MQHLPDKKVGKHGDSGLATDPPLCLSPLLDKRNARQARHGASSHGHTNWNEEYRKDLGRGRRELQVAIPNSGHGLNTPVESLRATPTLEEADHSGTDTQGLQRASAIKLQVDDSITTARRASEVRRCFRSSLFRIRDCSLLFIWDCWTSLAISVSVV